MVSYKKKLTWLDKLRGTPCPLCASSKEWDDWHKSAKLAHPVRYWLVEKCLPTLQHVFYYSYVYKFRDITQYIKHRFIKKSNALVAHPNDIPVGTYADLDHRLFFCSFNAFRDFVELECSHMHRWSNNIKHPKNSRDPENGIKYLESMTTGVHTIETTHDSLEIGKPTEWANAFKEFLDLYKWWTVTRPNRVEPDDASGLNEMYNNDPDHDMLSILFSPISDETAEKFKKRNQIEQDYSDEDTAMLIKLMKLRQFLWT